MAAAAGLMEASTASPTASRATVVVALVELAQAVVARGGTTAESVETRPMKD